MAKTGQRVLITLVCTECKERKTGETQLKELS